ncbi:ATP-binding protein [Gracilimonas sp.]|uniref:ATP-binding protein n=1 Tax=Gracilimonas sp. TaxID=1974203 RepID=UPI003BA8C57E
MQKRHTNFYSIFCIWSLVLFGCTTSFAQPLADKGTINLSNIDFGKQKSIALNGEWAFYWNNLVSPERIEVDSLINFVNFPHLWNEDPELSSYGYATYTVQIIKPANPPPLAITIPDLYTAYTLFINGEVISRNGRVATNRESYTPFWLPRTISIDHFSSDTLQVVLHVSNFRHIKGGIRLPIKLGMEEFLERERTTEIGYTLLLTGCLFMIGLFFMGLYLFGRHEVPMLYFAFVCFLFSYRIFGTGLYPLHYLFPDLPWILTIKAEYFSLYFTAALFCIFVHKLYPQESSKKFIYVFAGIFGTFSFVTIFFSPFYFTASLNLFFASIPVALAYITWVYIKAAFNKREGAWFALASVVIVFTVFMHNLLEYLTILEENLLLNFIGLFSFFFLQSLILSYRFTNSLSRARIKAEEAAKAKSQFLSTMSHEIRTPLNAVIGLSDLLLESKSEQEKQEFAQNIKQSGENLLEIINNILDYSKLESAGIKPDFQPVNIRKATDEILNMLLPLSYGKDLPISLEITQDTPKWVLTDKTQLKQILINLIGNAIKFTSEGKISILISPAISLDKSGSLLFSITDTGTGISDKDANRLFKSFTQVDASRTRKHGGTGLGLVISKKLVEALGGEIWFESEAGKGTTFFFTIEADETEPEEDQQVEMLSSPEHNTYADLNKLRVLVVEDNLMNQKVITSILSKKNLFPEIATNGKEAIELLGSKVFDLIFMDMEMPVMDGIDATQYIRKAFPKNNQPVIIAMTANAFFEDRERCLKAGMNDFISKPISMDMVEVTLKKWFS